MAKKQNTTEVDKAVIDVRPSVLSLAEKIAARLGDGQAIIEQQLAKLGISEIPDLDKLDNSQLRDHLFPLSKPEA